MANNPQSQDKLKHFAEEIGLIIEQMGLQRMVGRVLGWLLICDPPHQSMQELVEALNASKASISNSTRLLVQIGLIERISLPEFRHDHYRLKPGAWYEITKADLNKLISLHQVAERGLELLEQEGQDEQHKERLLEMHHICAFWERELPVLIERLEQTRNEIPPK